jgi:deoxyribodipyrimidine photo-lyase
MQKLTLFWFRRDLRLYDNAALYHALKSHKNVLPIFIFDKNILNKLEDKADARVQFIHHTILNIKRELQQIGSDIELFYDTPIDVFTKLAQQYQIEAVYANKDYEGYAIHRDAAIEEFLNLQNVKLYLYKDHVIFDTNEIVKDDGKPYTVFTPYSKKWKLKLTTFYYKSYPTQKYFKHLYKIKNNQNLTLQDLGFEPTTIPIPLNEVNETIIKNYTVQRDYPATNSTSKLGIHLRFGTISVRQLTAKALQLNQTYLNEIIWRDFYHQITYHFPHINEGISFKPAYDKIVWHNNETHFQKWCNGQTGYPIVDAGMRELNATGFMHNRVRMIVASFLCKHLLIDWRWGEAYFAKKLLDFDFAANNGGWQWASSSGCDAAPYFRIFNPYLQTEKFDKNFEYIKKWVPEYLNVNEYPQPIVVHEIARKKCLEVYKTALEK